MSELPVLRASLLFSSHSYRVSQAKSTSHVIYTWLTMSIYRAITWHSNRNSHLEHTPPFPNQAIRNRTVYVGVKVTTWRPGRRRWRNINFLCALKYCFVTRTISIQATIMSLGIIQHPCKTLITPSRNSTVAFPFQADTYVSSSSSTPNTPKKSTAPIVSFVKCNHAM